LTEGKLGAGRAKRLGKMKFDPHKSNWNIKIGGHHKSKNERNLTSKTPDVL